MSIELKLIMSVETKDILSVQALRAAVDEVPLEAETTPESVVNPNVPIFRNIDADDTPSEINEIESACMNCFKSGTTRLLLTKIPFYREMILMSFKCPHCGFENNETQSASEIQEKGIKIILKVKKATDLNRKVVTSDYTSIKIPEVELEVPAQSQKGEVTTVEGILEHTQRNLEQDQLKRRENHPKLAEALDEFIKKLTDLLNFEREFTLILEDISGNSFIENPTAPVTDPNCSVTHFIRSKKENQLLGFYDTESLGNDANEQPPESGVKKPSSKKHLLKPIPEDSWTFEDLHGEVMQFQTLCPECRSACETNMKMTNIPHFKEVVIMATVCDVCGCRTNEVKSGGGIEEKGVRFEVKVDSKEDLTRDVLKSETCSLRIPELKCEVGPAALGGRFTTVEGILTAMKDQLQHNDKMFHDSTDEKDKERLQAFLERFDLVLELKNPATLILDDPAGNSYVQSLADDDKIDSKLQIIRYERDFDQNEELGLNDMKTENYEAS